MGFSPSQLVSIAEAAGAHGCLGLVLHPMLGESPCHDCSSFGLKAAPLEAGCSGLASPPWQAQHQRHAMARDAAEAAATVSAENAVEQDMIAVDVDEILQCQWRVKQGEEDGLRRRGHEEVGVEDREGEQTCASDGGAFSLGHSDSCIEASEFLERFLE